MIRGEETVMVERSKGFTVVDVGGGCLGDCGEEDWSRYPITPPAPVMEGGVDKGESRWVLRIDGWDDAAS